MSLYYARIRFSFAPLFGPEIFLFETGFRSRARIGGSVRSLGLVTPTCLNQTENVEFAVFDAVVGFVGLASARAGEEVV